MRLIPVLLFVTGFVLIVSAIKNDHPVDTVMKALGRPGTRGHLDGSPQGVIMDITPNQTVPPGTSGGRSQFVTLPIVQSGP